MKELQTILIGLLFILLQITVLNLLTIHAVKPDFVVLFVIAQSIKNGPASGVVWGFCLGLILDTITGGLTGLAALAYSVAGFVGGKISQGKALTPIRYLQTFAIGIIVAFTILSYFLQPQGATGWLKILLTNTFPAILYTWLFVLIWVYSPFTKFQPGKDRV